jgi:hypothetical protein
LSCLNSVQEPGYHRHFYFVVRTSFGNRTTHYALLKTDFFENTIFKEGNSPNWALPAANQDLSDPTAV